MFQTKYRNQLHGKVINYEDLATFVPTRNKFLLKNEYKEVQDKIKKNKPLLFMPNSCYDTHIQDQKYQKAKYKIVLFGVLEDGRRSTVVIDGVQPFFEIWLPKSLKTKQDKTKFVNELLSEFKQDDNYCYTRYEVLEGRQFVGFNNFGTYVRLYFDKLKIRKNAMNLVYGKYKVSKNSPPRSLNILKTYNLDKLETTSDDKTSYYNVVCRDYLTTLTTWAVMENWRIDRNSNFKDQIIRVDIKDFKKYTADIMTDPKLSKDKTMTMAWDIETFSEVDTGDVPKPEVKTDRMFMIGITFQWYHDEEQMLRVCLVDVPSAPNKDFLTIVCHNEQNLIKAFADIFDRMNPDITCGFNDGDYDWPWVIQRAAQYPGILAYLAKKMQSTVPWKTQTVSDIMEYSYKKERIKVAADVEAFANILNVPGYLPIDVRTVFRQLYPTAEKTSLNWFLSKNKLGSKVDMPYQEMFRIYREMCRLTSCDSEEKLSEEDFKLKNNLKIRMAEVGKYCVIDAQRCNELLKIRNVIMDRRQVSDIAYTSPYDAYYRAGGMKVCNLTIAWGQLFGLRFHNQSNKVVIAGKYPGAFVVPPEKGLETSKYSFDELVAKGKEQMKLENPEPKYSCWANEEEHIQEYKDLVKEFGAVVEPKVVEQIAEKYKQKTGSELPEHVKGFFTRETGYPVTGLDFSSLYPSLIRAYNLSPEFFVKNQEDAEKYQAMGFDLHEIEFEFNNQIVTGWTIRHDNQINPDEWVNTPEYWKDPTKWKFKFGIIPFILNKLFNDRKNMKKILHKWESEKERLDALNEEEFLAQKKYYEDVIFNFNYIDSKQKALKIFMNTFYGQMGNPLSPLYVLEIAGGITTAGKNNIKMVKAFCEMLGCWTKYGDSVTKETPILISEDKKTSRYVMIQDLHELYEQEYEEYKSTKEIIYPKRELYVWSDLGWTAIKRLIRHKTDKKIYRIVTHKGIVDCTEDHSLLDKNGNELSPNDCKIGTELLHNELPDNICEYTEYSENAKWPDKEKYWMAYAYVHNSLLRSGVQIKLNSTTEAIGYRTRKTKLDKIIRIKEVKYGENQYVYDLETENHHFSAGIGELIVHNTDSVYIKMPVDEFKEADMLYYSGQISKIEYWHKLVEITFKVIKIINKKVNDMLCDDNGTEFLKMAYEEALFPVAFLAKKKYYGIPHISVPNFEPKDLFIRGLEVKKRGVSKFLRDQCLNIMWKSVSVNNIDSLKELVEKTIDHIYIDKEFTFNDFIKSDVYKPPKKGKPGNVKVITFVNRMNEKLGAGSVPLYERFNYVIVKRYPYRYDERGRKSHIKVGDKMEYVHIAQKENMEIDLDYYMEKSVNGQLARLIVYHPMFDVKPDDESDEALKKAEEKIYQNACTYVKHYCKKYFEKYECMGAQKKEIYKKSQELFKNTVSKRFDNSLVVDLISSSWDSDKEDLYSWLNKYISKLVQKNCKGFGLRYVTNKLKGKTPDEKRQIITQLSAMYYGGKNNLMTHEINKYEDRYARIKMHINDNIKLFQSLHNFKQNVIQKMNDMIENKEIDEENMGGIDDDILLMIEYELMDIINDYKDIVNKLIAIETIKYETLDIVDNIKKENAKLFRNYEQLLDTENEREHLEKELLNCKF